jgi:uncharacterized protein YggT (Ycf19 family)
LQAIESYILLLRDIYFYMILIYVLMSWVPTVRESFVGELLGKLVEPYLQPFRRLIPAIGGVIDVSPIVALFALQFIAKGLIAVLSLFIR